MKKGIKKVLTLGLVGLTLAGTTAVPINAAEKTQSETKQVVMKAKARSIASFRTFKIGDSSWSVKLTGLPSGPKNVSVYVIRGGKEHFMRAMNEWSSVAWFSGSMKSFTGTKLVKVKPGDKLKVVVKQQLTSKTLYNVTSSAKY